MPYLDDSDTALYTQAIDAMIQGLKLMNQRRDLFDEAAKSMSLMRDALIRAGFTAEQAMEIVSRQGGIKTK